MTKTHRLTVVAILGALSFVLMLWSFPIMPGVDFLKVELSVLPVLIGVIFIDLKTGYQILLLRTLLKLLLNNHGINDVIGLPMNVIALGIFVTCFALFYKKDKTTTSLILSGLMGTLGLTAAMLLLNYVYAIPLYAKAAHVDIAAYYGIWPYLSTIVLPFNLIQGGLFTLACAVILLPLKQVLEKQAYVK